jgi:hypothetical protein
MQKIHFNGKEYDSLDDMPPSERQAYEKIMSILVDKNQNGVPDIFEGDVLHNLVRTAASTVFVDGKQVSSLESLPPEKRAKYEQALAKLKELGIVDLTSSLSASGQPNLWQDMAPGLIVQQPTMGSQDADIRPSEPIVQPSSVIQEDSGVSWSILLLVAVLIITAALAAAVFFLLR